MQVNLTGVDQASRKLRLLADPKAAKRIARKAARQAMNIVRDAARQNAKAIDDPETREMIFKNITTQGGKSRNRNEIKMRVGVRGGSGQNQYSKSTAGLSGGDTRHFRFIEYGTSTIPATPFMRPALESNIQVVTDKFMQGFGDGLDMELDKL